MLFKNTTVLLIMLLGCLYSLPSYAQQVTARTPWELWVADRHADLNCPWLISANKKKVCNWPGEFVGEIVNDGMLFEMSVRVFSKETLINLPGSKKHWPTGVTVNQQAAAVIDSSGRPKLQLKKGSNIIRGKFLWQTIPPALALANSIALVKVVKNGQVLPTSINNNQLILSQQSKGAPFTAENSLKVQVYHALQDGVPIRLTSIIKLIVSGKSREIAIGQVAPAGTKSLYLDSPLPARLEKNGLLRVQVKPGIYQIKVGSRFSDNVSSISSNKLTPEWPRYEYFSFIADPRIREVKISGVKSIDTSLHDIPVQWQSYPTYRLQKSDKLQLTTTVRGDSAEHQNSINIAREIWLSFAGTDATSKDTISGQMHQGWRLNAAKSVKLGRAAVNSQAVLITEFAGNEGVEIRSPQINLQAVSSIPRVNQINAVGWQTDAAKLSATIHLPPGWRAVHASGVDGISGTWLQQWSLWDIFWLMILIAVANKLLGVKGALLMAVTLIFSFHERLAPNALWAALLASIAIISLPIGKYKVLLSRLALFPAALLVIAFISIAISSLRLAIYPTLEKHSAISSYQSDRSVYQPSSVEKQMLLMEEADNMGAPRSKSQPYQRPEQELYQVGDNDRVQTGPGIPAWSWNALTIRSTGIVTAEQQINLLLSSPLLTAAWRIINVLLIGLMAVLILRALFRVSQFSAANIPYDKGSDGESGTDSQAKKSTESGSTVASFFIIILPLLMLSSEKVNAAVELPQEQGYPPEYLLQEYESKLLQAPACLPSCASLNNGLLVIKDKQLSLSFELLAAADIALPLPSAGDTWTAEKITLDNKPAVLRKTRGVLSVYLPQGVHTITMHGRVKHSQISINLPLNIHNFSVDAPAWLIDGLREGVVENNNISLTSKEVLAQQESNTLIPLPVKPYAIVQRTITLGKQWTMLTRVEKVAPTAEAGSFNIDLLAGEQILSAYPVNDNGTVNVQIPKNQKVISWQSSLPQTAAINLKAASSPSYSETWRVIPSSIWHVNFTGIKPLKSDLSSGQLQPTWKPWPGESLTVEVSRPAGVTGDIFTTEMARLTQQSGKNVQKFKLMLTVRASQGTDYEIILPGEANITSLRHDGSKMSINNGNRVLVQLHPGEQRIELEFETRTAMSWRNRTAKITLPGKTVNINIDYHMLQDRWLLYLDGPSLGAAMLYWGVLFVILIAALLLPMLAHKLRLQMPIATPGWILLGLGFSTVNSYGVLIIALFFFVLAFRKQHIQPAAMERWKFNALQLMLLFLTFVSVTSLLSAIPVGLLSSPDMQVVGNGSYSHLFKFFQDKVTGQLPVVTVYSLPIWFYRVVMLAWSLWAATRLITWGKWWFAAYSRHGAWIAKPPKVEEKPKVTVTLEKDE